MKSKLLGFARAARRLALVAGGCAFTALAVTPVVKTVPWVASNPLIPHDTFAGKEVALKGTCDVAGAPLANFEWTWDFGDGTTPAVGTVSDAYMVEARHVYAGPVGKVWTARLTVRDKTTDERASKTYFVEMKDKTLEVEANIAIDEGLWYLHKTQTRYTLGSGVTVGRWWEGKYGGYATVGYVSVTAANVNAFEVNGHHENGSADNPYSETVQRGLRQVFEWLYASGIGMQTNPKGTFNPDSNGNGLGVFVNQSYPFYQGGMFMDAIIASDSPEAVTVTGPANVIGRKYKDVVQDMVDAYAWAQYDGSPGGGWRYNANEYPDNSACQWAAIGLIPAERNWGLTVPPIVKDWNIPWLGASQYNSPGSYYHGAFGYYPGYWFPWGPYATTPSGMVQMVMDGIGRGMTGPGGWPSWDAAETFIRDKFGNTGGPSNSIKDYYYGLFSFVKSMLLHRPAIVMLQSQTAGVAPLDWYAAEASAGAPTDGVARTLVNDQSAGGFWWGNQYEGSQQYFDTAWAIMMLHRTVVESGLPRAVAKAVPNPCVAGQVIVLDGSDSFHQNPGLIVDSWDWDFDGDGSYEVSGVMVNARFDSTGNYPVKLRVTDNASPENSDETTVVVRVTTPPVPPTADADGPYVFCPRAKPWFLTGWWSVNPDEGQHEPGCPTCPGDMIKRYEWDLDGDGEYDDATGPTPDVTAFFETLGPGAYLVGLKVTDNTSESYPTSTMGDLSSTTKAQVFVKTDNDTACECVELAVDVKYSAVFLNWNADPLAASYNVYRSLLPGGPYIKLANVTDTAYKDTSAPVDMKYYYVVRPAALNGDELCQSNEIEASPVCPPPQAKCVRTYKVSNNARYYRELISIANECYGRAQLRIWVGDTASGIVAGPFTNGEVVRISPAAAGKPAKWSEYNKYGIRALIEVKGQAVVWAQDPLGHEGPKETCP